MYQPVVRDPVDFRYDEPTRRQGLRLVARWLARSQEEARGIGSGYRDLLLTRDGQVSWKTPHSCTGERINVLVEAHRALGEDFLDRACEYAERMLADPVFGIYDGPRKELRGACHHSLSSTPQRVYATVYSMRLPRAFAALADATRNSRYADWFTITAGHLLSTILPNGLVVPAFWHDQPQPASWENHSISIRVGYMIGELAWLARRTGSAPFADAARNLARWFVRLQDPAGAFAETIDLGAGVAFGDYRSNHMQAYVLAGLSRGVSELEMDEQVVAATRRSADYLLQQLHRYHRIPASVDRLLQEKRPDWALYPMYDGALALYLASVALHDDAYRAAADRLACDFLLAQCIEPEHPACGCAPYATAPCGVGYLAQPEGGWSCDGHSTTWMGGFLAERLKPPNSEFVR